MNNLVSVLIPCFNHERYVIDSLRSIVESSYYELELIFIDDGSIDRSFETAKRYIDLNRKRFKRVVCKTQDNIGITKTLNLMVSLASGYYITLVASDDILTTNSIRDRIEFIEKNGKDAVIGKAYIINEEGKISSKDAGKKLFHASKRLLGSEYINKELIMRWSVVGPTLLLKKEVYSKIGMYNEDLRVEDRDFYLRLIKNNSIVYMDKNVALYRIHEDNTSRRTRIKNRKNFLKEICNTNINYKKFFKNKIEKTYLSSYKVDLFLLNKNKFNILVIYKLFRIILTELYLLIFEIRIRVIDNERYNKKRPI